jgi:serine/threonine protein phosphatase 1
MQRLAVIGDVHGRADKLERLLAVEEIAERSVVFLGDLVNRGPDARRVLDIACEWVAQRNATVLLGNHEDVLLGYIENADFVRFALSGGLPTIRSYVGHASGDVHAQLVRAIPKEHRQLLERASLYCESDEFILSHAGVDPGAPADRSKRVMVQGVGSAVFERRSLLPKLCVCGHYVQRDGRPFVSDTLVCIDTGCGTACGPLTAFLLPERAVVQVR